MLYLKNTLGGIGRSLTGSALHTFQGPHRWWKLALYAAVFVLPGGSIAVLLFAWADQRRARAAHEGSLAASAATLSAQQPASLAAPKPLLATATTCEKRNDAPPCRAAAGKQARQTCDARS